MMQQPPIQLLQLTCLYWNENFDSTLINGYFEKNWDSHLEHVVSLFNTSCNINITKKN